MLFWIITAAMILVALLMLAPSLLRRQASDNLDRDQQNVVIARERLAELKSEHAQGILTDAQFEKTRGELEQALLLDLGEGGSEGGRIPSDSPTAGRLALVATAVLVPLLTLGLYNHLGSPQLIDPTQARSVHAGAGQGATPSVEEMMRALVKRLQENPEDTEGWFLLGRSYMAIKDYPRAATTFERLHQMVGDEPAVLLSWADAQAMAQSGNISGKPAELIKRAIKLVPEDTTALWLAGIVAEEEGDYQLAIDYWGRLQPKLADDPASQQKVSQLIAGARDKAGDSDSAPAGAQAAADETAAAPAAPEGVRLRVSMTPAMAAIASPEDSLFIYAKAVQGPPMPLAAARVQVRDLPLEITLDDSLAMMPAMRISNFEQVTVGARGSRSGNPVASSGDLTGEVSPVSVQGAGLVEVVIGSQLP